MKEAYASFPPLGFAVTTDAAGVATTFSNSLGYNADTISTSKYAAASVVEIDLRGLTIKDKSLLVKNLHVARLPSFDDTFPKGVDPSTDLPYAHGVYQITDMHLVTTSPLCYDQDTETGTGLAAAQNQQVQLEILVGAMGFMSTNNNYSLQTPGIQSVATTINANTSPMLNFDPNMIVMCQTDVLTSSMAVNPANAVLFNPVYSSVYGMADIAALESLWCYRLVYVSMRTGNSSTVGGKIGPSIIQMRTEEIQLGSLQRLQVMESNFNTTNDKLA